MRLLSILLCFALFGYLCIPVYGTEIEAPLVPDSGRNFMPENTESFGDALMELMNRLILQIRPELKQAMGTCMVIVCCVLIISVLSAISSSCTRLADFLGVTTIALILMKDTGSMIQLGVDTVYSISEYGKLLVPIMTAATAAQGGITSSGALYAGTMLFDSVLVTLIADCLVPLIYVFLAFAAAGSAIEEDILRKLRDLIKTGISWTLKTLLTIFTTYMGITGVVSGTTDAAALKATKVTIASVVPVVGGILADASEAVLVSAGLAKNAAGIYGILAMLAVFLMPFLQIGIRYLLLKAICSLCAVFGSKRITGMIEDFSAAMGLLLAMTGSVCLLMLISTVCFMRGVG